MAAIMMIVNGTKREVQVATDTPLLYVLRNDLGLTAAKFGCGLEQCYACAVLVDGEAVTSCATAVELIEAGTRGHATRLRPSARSPSPPQSRPGVPAPASRSLL